MREDAGDPPVEEPIPDEERTPVEEPVPSDERSPDEERTPVEEQAPDEEPVQSDERSPDEEQAPIEERVGEALREADATLAVAESCTGGLVASLVTDVAGASDYFDRGLVAYSYDSKRDLLAVARETLDEHGAVSAAAAAEMARGVRDTADATWGLATTGVAGPTGGTDETPVGTVYVGIAYAGPWGTGSSFARTRHHEYDGDRRAVKEQIARGALGDLLAAVEKSS